MVNALMVSVEIFSVVPPTEPFALRSTQSLKVSSRGFSWGKACWCLWLTTYHRCSAETSRKSGGLNLPGTPWATSARRGTPLLYLIYCPAITNFNRLPCTLNYRMNRKVQFRAALRRTLKTNSYYFVDTFLLTMTYNLIVGRTKWIYCKI